MPKFLDNIEFYDDDGNLRKITNLEPLIRQAATEEKTEITQLGNQNKSEIQNLTSSGLTQIENKIQEGLEDLDTEGIINQVNALQTDVAGLKDFDSQHNNLLNGGGQDSLMQYGGTQTASAGSPATGRIGNSAEGKYAVSLGRYVHSDARNTITLGYTSVNNSAYGTVIGRGNYSEGDNSVVIGKYNNNKGADNYIIGTFNNLEDVSHCYLFGNGLTAIKNNNFIIGSNNDSSHNNGYDIFQIGDGWGSGATETKDKKFNLVTVLKRVRDAEGKYSYGGYMEITIQGNTPNSVIKKSTMDAAIGNIYSKDKNGVETGVLIDKVNEVETETDEKLQEVNQLISDGLVVATDEKPGLVGIGYVQNSKNYPVKLDVNNRAYVNVPWSNTTYSNATSTNNGLMSSGDKTKLDTFETNYKLVTTRFYITIDGQEIIIHVSYITSRYASKPSTITNLAAVYYNNVETRCGSIIVNSSKIDSVLYFNDRSIIYVKDEQIKTAPQTSENVHFYKEDYIITTSSAI